MSPDIMESEFPPECHEPCSYNTTDYRLSMSKFPAQVKIVELPIVVHLLNLKIEF